MLGVQNYFIFTTPWDLVRLLPIRTLKLSFSDSIWKQVLVQVMCHSFCSNYSETLNSNLCHSRDSTHK